MKRLFFGLLAAAPLLAAAQSDRWQQRVKYTMTVDMDVATNLYKGAQKLEYWNNSPDTLRRVFLHLYWNAFQPHSMMDERSRRQGALVLRKDRNGNDIADWDPRVEDRILNLKPDEIGYERVTSIKVNGREQQTKLHETILEVILDKPLLPKTKTTFDMTWDAQVPLQIRRSGRDNPGTQVRYTMTQWYPKMVEYDYEGWHPTPYIAREFYGVWGDYDVTIRIDKNYLLAGSGTVTNAAQVGFGYEPKGTKVAPATGEKLTWRFNAPNVHDFAWAADPEYKHIVRKTSDGITINVVYNGQASRAVFNDMSVAQKASYKNDFEVYAAGWDQQWETIADAAVTVYPFIKQHFGAYPYQQYSFIQGGDGGMEYPNCTMINGPSLGTAFHEWMHTWYQMMMGTNESLHSWMDEGFTEYATNLVEAYYASQMRPEWLKTNPAGVKRSDSIAAVLPLFHKDNYASYLALAKSGREEPLTTHSDQYNTNYAYSNAAYNKGCVFMEQLGYIVGAPVRDRILLDYYSQWRFKHPNPNDLIRVAEKRSGLQLDWYRGYWVNTTKTIDYGIDSVWTAGEGTRIRVRDIGQMPMPLDVKVTFRDGTSEWHYIPQYLQFGEKPAEKGQEGRRTYPAWKWTHPTYEIQTGRKLTDIVLVEIDPSLRMADIDRKNNRMELKW
jgi:hypothetical protein